MITIHNSSLSFQPASTTAADRPAGNALPKASANPEPDTQDSSRVSPIPSTTDQFRRVAESTALAEQSSANTSSVRHAKALASYRQTDTQALRQQLTDQLSRIDLYA